MSHGSPSFIIRLVAMRIATFFCTFFRIFANIKISFYDLSGDKITRDNIIQTVLNEKPDVVIGPLFAEDTKTIRDIKPNDLPVISFTSDATALGNGVMTINLLPTQSIETADEHII